MSGSPVAEREEQFERLQVTQEPIRIRFESEMFIVPTHFGYTAAANVMAMKTKRRWLLLMSARSICKALEPLREEYDGQLKGIEVWIKKSGPERSAAYVITE